MITKMPIKKRETQLELLMQFFKENPNRDIPHPEIVDWATSEWKKRKGDIFRDPDRGIRSLHQKGCLIKVKKGVYRYNPNIVQQRTLENFSKEQKEKILKRDSYRCVICGKGKQDGIELHIDHIKPKDLGGRATIDNGQTLCAQHNFIKKNFKQTETGKKMFIRLYHLAKKEKNALLQSFCMDVLKIYEVHNINGHIEWDK